MDEAFNSFNNDVELEKIYNTSGHDKTFSMFIIPISNFSSSFFVDNSISLATFTEYIAIDVELNQNDTYFNGITKASDSTESLINIFRNTTPHVNQIQNITPSNSDGFMSFTFDDFEILKTNLLKFNKKDSITNSMTLFNDIIEVGVIYEDEKRAIVLNSTDVIATEDALLSEQTIADTYREINIYNFSQPVIFANTFTPLIKANKVSLLL